MPSLDHQARMAKNIIKDGLHAHPTYAHWPFPAERDILVLWGTYHGCGVRAIVRDIGCSTTTVKNVRSRFHKDPSEIFRNPVLSGILRAGKGVWEWEVGGLPLPGSTERKARIHVARHFVPEMVIQLNGVMPKP